MSSMMKSLARRMTDTARSSDRDSASRVETTAIEGRRKPALTVAYSPKDSHDIEADIVFVGGVDGDSPLSDSWLHRETHVHWPSQLLPTDVPTARILLYCYALDTKMFSASPADENLEWHAEKLVAELASIRVDTYTASDQEDRKIIFVAQGIGGLIVQRSVREDSDGPQVAMLTLGIIFLGAQLRGSDRRGWASLGSKIARLGDLDERTLSDQMMLASDYLNRLSSEFYQTIHHSPKSRKIEIAAFYEDYPTPDTGFVVAQHDAIPRGDIGNGIPATHANLARYSEKTHLGYVKVASSISRWIGGLRSQAGQFRVVDYKAFAKKNRLPRDINASQASAAVRAPMDLVVSWGDTLLRSLEPPLTFVRSLLSHSYTYIVGHLLDFLERLSLCEPPLLAHCVRLQWSCDCGNSFFKDYLRSELSSAYDLRDLLLNSGYQAALFINPGAWQPTAQSSDASMQHSVLSLYNHETQTEISSDYEAEPRPSQGLGGKITTANNPSEILERDNGYKAMWILVCFYYNRYVSQAVHLDTQDGDDDVSLIKRARQKYFEKRGWFAYYMSWNAVTKIAFVKFDYILDPIMEEGLALLHEDWVPPKGWKDTKLWEPCPTEPRPVAEQRFLLHLWNHPHHSRTYLVIQTTKLRLIAQAKSSLSKWRIQQLDCDGLLRKTRDQYKRFRGWYTSGEQLPYSNPNNLQRIDDHGNTAQRATAKGRYLFKSTPKRLEKELKAHLDEPPLGWGLHLEESIVVPAPLRYLGIFIIIALILSAVVSALVLIHEKGMAYFGMGNSAIGIAAVVTPLVVKLIDVRHVHSRIGG